MSNTENIRKVVKLAKKHKAVSNDLIDLYERISLLVYRNDNNLGYECAGSGMGFDGIDWTIVVPKGKPLPKEIGELFFNNVSLEYKVNCNKVDEGIYDDQEDAYNFIITKP